MGYNPWSCKESDITEHKCGWTDGNQALRAPGHKTLSVYRFGQLLIREGGNVEIREEEPRNNSVVLGTGFWFHLNGYT